MALSKSTRWGAYLIGFIIVLYGAQWLLESLFLSLNNDSIATALRPLQNHYFSFSKYYITTEGALGEFTEDSTGVGRMIGPLVIGAIIWFLLVATVAYIEWLEKYNGYIVLFITMAILMESIYTSFFAPPRKAIFTENEVILEKSNVFLAYAYPSSSRVEIKHDLIDKFEFDFYKSKDLYFDALFLQIFIVVDGKRYLIGENQISSNHSSYIPSEEQKKEGQKYVDILTKLIGR